MASKRTARVELTADERPLERGLRRSKSSLDSFKKSVGRSFADLFSTLRTAGGIGGLGVAGLFGLEAQKTLKFEESLTRLQIATGQSAQDMGALREKMVGISNSTGVAREDILGATSAFVALTGDAKGAADSMDLFARVQRGTGASMEDIASAAAAMKQNLQIDPASMEKAFSILIRQGKAGAVELRDMAGLMAELAPMGAQFAGGLGTQGLADLGAALQLARQGFGSAAEAATGLQALMGSIAKHAKQLKAGGVQVFDVGPDGTKRMKSFREVVEAIGNSKLVKDPTKLIKALGSKEAYQAFLQLTKVDGAWQSMAQSTMRADDVAKDYATFQNSQAGKMQASWNELKNTVASVFTPDTIREFGIALATIVESAKLLLGTLSQLPAVGEDIADAVYDKLHPDEVHLKKKSIENLAGRLRDPEQAALLRANAGGMSLNQEEANLIGVTGTLPMPVHMRLMAEEVRRRTAPLRARRGMLAAVGAVGAPAYGVAPVPMVNAEADAAAAAASFGPGALLRDANRVPTRSGSGRMKVDVKVGVDPASGNLAAGVANDRRQAVRP